LSKNVQSENSNLWIIYLASQQTNSQTHKRNAATYKKERKKVQLQIQILVVIDVNSEYSGLAIALFVSPLKPIIIK